MSIYIYELKYLYQDNGALEKVKVYINMYLKCIFL
jgi:hypothetical protein